MSSNLAFRSPTEETTKLLEELADLRATLAEMRSRLLRMEARVKRAFPIEAASVQQRRREQIAKPRTDEKPSLNREQALALFDEIVSLAAGSQPSEAEHLIVQTSPADLLFLGRELGISFGRSKPSKKALTEGIMAKVRESVLLGKHSTSRPAPAEQ
jgi:hypothetical protein